MEENKKPELTQKQNKLVALKFFLFSISAGVIQIGSFTILNELVYLEKLAFLDKVFINENGFAYFISLVLSVIWNFTFNRKFTFKSAVNVPVAMLKVFGFYLVFTPLSVWLVATLTGTYGWNEYLATLLNMVINLVTEYLFCRFVVYRNELYTNEQGQKELEQSQGD